MKKFNLTNIKEELILIIYLFLGLLPIISTLVYFLYSLNNVGLLLTFTLTFISVFFIFSYLRKRFNKPEEKNINQEIKTKKEKYYSLISIVIIMTLIFLSFREVFLTSSTKAIISPWSLINRNFFIYYFFSTIFLLYLIIKNWFKKNTYLIIISIFYFLSFSICLISYYLGYGFDPFIHQATVEFIAEKGFILPKTPYYLGQYGLVISLNKLTGVSLAFINKIITPLLAAILIPLSFFSFLKKIKSDSNIVTILLSIVSILAISFSPFIITTPQNLSYVFLILTIFFALKEKNLVLAIVYAIATITIHPLSGIPLIGFLLFIYYFNKKEHLSINLRRVILIFIFLFNVLAIPLALFLGGGKNINFLGIKTVIIKALQTLINFQSVNQEGFILNLFYFFQKNFTIIVILIIISSVIFFFKNFKEKENNNFFKFKALLFSIFSLIISYFLSAAIMFQDVISYEQNDYIKRILILIIIFSLPFILLYLENLFSKIINKNNFTKFSWLLFFSILILISLYNSHPRLDNYYNSRGYNVSANDLEAVISIENIAQEKYIVLANQQVSAAALKTFGFNRYLTIDKQEFYFYPIPTGGKLYEYYLLAVYDSPNKENIKKAMDFSKVNEVYLVVNKYWDNSAKIINDAKAYANSFWQINNDVFIFQYLR